MSNMEVNSKYRIPDSLWARLHPLLPPAIAKPKGGRPRMDDRKALDAIFYVLCAGCQWNALPRSLGASSTVHDRFQEWREQGVFERFWQAGLVEVASEIGIDWECRAMDGAIVKAPLGEKATGANPTDRGKSGSKRSLLVEGKGIPLAVVVDGANRHDMKLVEPPLEAQQIVPEDLPEEIARHLCLDKGYDYDEVRAILEVWGYVGHIPPRDKRKRIIKDIPNYRAHRWVVERTHSWMNRFRRLLIRWEKKVENYLALLHLACAFITFRAAKVFG